MKKTNLLLAAVAAILIGSCNTKSSNQVMEKNLSKVIL
jgi:hypothetical protein